MRDGHQTISIAVNIDNTSFRHPFKNVEMNSVLWYSAHLCDKYTMASGALPTTREAQLTAN